MAERSVISKMTFLGEISFFSNRDLTSIKSMDSMKYGLQFRNIFWPSSNCAAIGKANDQERISISQYIPYFKASLKNLSGLDKNPGLIGRASISTPKSLSGLNK